MNEIQVKEEKILLSIKEYWFLIPSTLTFLGCCDLYFYYSLYFKIEIFHYIAGHEILTSFFSENFLFIVILSFPFLNCFVLYKLMPKIPLNGYSIFGFSILFLAVFSYYCFFEKTNIFISLSAGVAVILPFLDIRSIIKRIKNEKVRDVGIVLLCTGIAFGCIFLLKYKSDKLADERITASDTTKVSFIYNGFKVETNDFIRYIGGTMSTVFLFNKSDSSVRIYDRNRLDSFSLKVNLN
jgi:hypothetical protein